MTSTRILVALMVALALSSAVAQDYQCGEKWCEARLGCCNTTDNSYQCFDPTEYNCLTDYTSNKTLLCGSSEGIFYQTCGNTCYNPTQFTCFSIAMTSGPNELVLCGLTNGRSLDVCGVTCYDFSAYQCCSGKLYSFEDPNIPCLHL